VIYRTRLQDISRVVGQFPYKLKKRKSAFSCSYRVILRADHFLTSKLDFDPTTCYVTTVLRGNPKRVEEADSILYLFFAYSYKYTDDDEFPWDKLKQYLRVHIIITSAFNSIKDTRNVTVRCKRNGEKLC
jgi:hypothetical protein